MEQITIRFDGTGPDGSYKIEKGTLMSTGGNSGGCLDGGTGKVTHARIRVELPFPSTVTSVSLDWYKYHGSTLNLGRLVRLYSADGTLLTQLISPTHIKTPVNTWVTTSAATNTPNVSYAVFEIHASLASGLHAKMDNCIINYNATGPNEPSNDGDSQCEIGAYAGNGAKNNPVSIRHGEKREEFTDLTLNTPSGELKFIRTYRQSKQADYTFMGAGWTHHHFQSLTKIAASPNKLIIRLSTGGKAEFTETSPNHYSGAAGVSSTVDWDDAANQYILQTTDGVKYIFNEVGELLSRAWPTGESWTYTYSNGKLSEVSDGYGRKLTFRYYAAGDFQNLLYRVGDQTFDDTNPNTPTGRYTEYSYNLNKIVNTSGQIVNGMTALLTGVRDVNGYEWNYTYYGQQSTETDVRQLNFLLKRTSPITDTNGDASPDSSVMLEDVTYTMQGTELAVNGGMEVDSSWTNIIGAEPITNERSIVQVDSGTYARRIVTSAANQGIEGISWNLTGNRTYIITARVYPVSGSVKMQVSGETAFDAYSFGVNGWETLRAVYKPSSNSTGRRLQFVANDAAAEFYVDTVSILESDLSVKGLSQARGNGEIVTSYYFQPNGNNVTNEVTAGRVTGYLFDNGVHAATVDHAGNTSKQQINSQYRSDKMLDGKGNLTQLSWSGDGKLLSSVTDALSNITSFTYDAENRLFTSMNAQNIRTLYLYTSVNDPRQPSHVLVTDEAGYASNLITNGSMESAGNWANLGLPTTNTQSNTKVDSGSYARRVVASSADGIGSDTFDLAANTACLITARVYVVSGAVKMRVTGMSSFDAFSATTGKWETLIAVHKSTTAVSGVQLEFVAHNGAAEFYVDNVYVLSGMRILRWQQFTYDTKGRTLAEKVIDPLDGTAALQEMQRTYHTSGNGNGLLESMIQIDMQNIANNQSTSYTYDSAGRVIKTQKSSMFGSCQISFTVYDAAGNVVASICNYDQGTSSEPTTAAEAAALYNSANPDKNQVTTHEYDAMGRRMKTTTNAGASFAQTTLTLYDALSRVWRTISNYKNPVVNGTPTYTAPGTWTWDTTDKRWEDSTGQAVSHGGDKAENIISDTLYNARGSIQLQRDVLGNVTLYGYDDGDRLVKVVQNANTPTYNNDYIGAGANPSLSSYSANSAVDVDIITQQAYDADGNRIKSIDPLNAVTFTTYDKLNRPEQTVSSASNPNYDLATNGNFNAYTFSTNADQDLRQKTTYDSLGRVLTAEQLISKVGTTDNWVVTRSVYDSLGRLRFAIRNYVDQGEDPSLWAWDETDIRWEKSDSTAIDHGVNNDQNLITEQVYDENGRVKFSREMSGAKTWLIYDGLGRQVKQIAGVTYAIGTPPPESSSYVGAKDDPAADVITQTYFDDDGRVVKTRRLQKYDTDADSLIWVWTLNGYDGVGRVVKTIQNASTPNYNTASDPDLSDYVANANVDEDLISQTIYDIQGRVYKTVDTMSSVTLYGFDSSGRRVKTIQNASSPNYDVTVDPDLSDYGTSSDADKDLITETTYDVAGRVVKAKDVQGQITFYGYDRAGRCVKTVQNASNMAYDIFANPTLATYTVVGGATSDQDVTTTLVYDKAGRTVQSKTTWNGDATGKTEFTVYDRDGRVTKTIQNYIAQATTPDQWTWRAVNNVFAWRLNATTNNTVVSSGTQNDQNIITETLYDKRGQVQSIRTSLGVTTYFVHDKLGRRIRAVENYAAQAMTPDQWVWREVSGVFAWRLSATNNATVNHGTAFDQNLISDTAYNKAGQVVSTRDARGTATKFGYDRLWRRVQVIEAANTNLETVSYTCYDKAGQVERVIRNYVDTSPQPVSPDAKDISGNWLFNPTTHGMNDDQNLITTYTYDRAGRRISVNDLVGSVTSTSYFRDGQMATETDPEGTVTLFRYDGVYRRTLVVQGYEANLEDPAAWVWDAVDSRWEQSSGTAISHGINNDRNIIVRVTYDKAGRILTMRDPRGNVTQYEYDNLGRRKKLKNPLNIEWLTSYANQPGGNSSQTMTYPGLDSGTYNVQRDFDRLGRLKTINYNAASTTPTITFDYNTADSRMAMSERDASNVLKRQTTYGYDQAQRLISVAFDNDGNGTTDDVTYLYDTGGYRTRMKLPGAREINYGYDARGRLVSLTDWSNQQTTFVYDGAGRHITTQRANGFTSRYQHDVGGRLRVLRHTNGSKTLGHFAYEVDQRGNRVQALEALPRPNTGTTTIDATDTDSPVIYEGSWTLNGGLRETSVTDALLRLMFFGDDNITLTMGQGPDHSIYDVYIGGSLWQSFDGYAATAGEVGISVSVTGDGPHLLEIRNRADKNPNAMGYKLRFKSLIVNALYDLHTIAYQYDALARVIDAKYFSGQNTGGNPFRTYTYGFDVAGNRISETINGVTTNTSYNAANQVSTFTYDPNGNLTSDGTNAYTWDRANRLLSMGGSSYKYDGLGNRVQQMVNGIATDYLLDLQPGLATALAAMEGSATIRYVYGPRGIHAECNVDNTWQWMLQDGLGSVRGVVDNASNIAGFRHFEPYGEAFSTVGTVATMYNFTGEPLDGNGLLHLRARYYGPNLGVFTALDPYEGLWDTPSSINRYRYVGGNPVNRRDPSGMCWVNSSASPDQQSQCYDAWRGYTDLITYTHTQNWPRDVRILVTQEARYWGNLSYSGFVSQWNSSRPPASTDPGGQVIGIGLPIAGVVSQADSPFPGPADLIALGVAVCAAGLAALANAGAVSLPLRQPVEFARSDDDVLPIPRVLPRDRTDGTIALFHYGTQGKIAFILTTQIIPLSDETVNPKRARYGSGIYFTELGPFTLTKSQLARRLYGNPFPATQRSVEAWVYVDLSELPLIFERPHVFRVPTTGPLLVTGRIMASGITS